MVGSALASLRFTSVLDCDRYQYERKLILVRSQKRVSFLEVKNRMLTRLLCPGVTYASVLGKFRTRRPPPSISLLTTSSTYIPTSSSSTTPSASLLEVIHTTAQQKRLRSEDSLNGTPHVNIQSSGRSTWSSRDVGFGRYHCPRDPGREAAGALWDSGVEETKPVGNSVKGRLGSPSSAPPSKLSPSAAKVKVLVTCPHPPTRGVNDLPANKGAVGARNAFSKDLSKHHSTYVKCFFLFYQSTVEL